MIILGGLPVFVESSSPELTDLLINIRTKRILPSLLNAEQRKLIQSRKMKSQLENEPVYATIGEEEVRLTHFDPTTEVPKAAAFLDVLEMTNERQDWRNLPPLLEGLYQTNMKMRPKWLHMLVNKAFTDGMLPVVIQCLQQVKTNGMTLRDEVLREKVMTFIRLNARNQEWSEEATLKSLKQAQQVLELMDEPEHCGNSTVGPEDPRADPSLIGIPLELAAVRAKNHLGGSDKDGVVAMYLARLLPALQQQTTSIVRDPFPYS